MVTAAHNVFRGTRVCVWAAQNTQNIGIAHRARQRVPGAYGVAQISPWWLLGPPVASPPILLPLYQTNPAAPTAAPESPASRTAAGATPAAPMGVETAAPGRLRLRPQPARPWAWWRGLGPCASRNGGTGQWR